MLIGTTYIRDKSLVLIDIDGSEASMPLSHALKLAQWIEAHRQEIEEAIQQPDNGAALPEWIINGEVIPYPSLE